MSKPVCQHEWHYLSTVDNVATWQCSLCGADFQHDHGEPDLHNPQPPTVAERFGCGVILIGAALAWYAIYLVWRSCLG